jgi:hypothetical protein
MQKKTGLALACGLVRIVGLERDKLPRGDVGARERNAVQQTLAIPKVELAGLR